MTTEHDKLVSALRYALEAIETGRSEPLFVARDLIRNTLEDCPAPAPSAGETVLVPREPTEAMIAAGWQHVTVGLTNRMPAYMVALYQAMLAAAPTAGETP